MKLKKSLLTFGVIFWVLAPLLGVYILNSEIKAQSFTAPITSWAPVQSAGAEQVSGVEIALQWSTKSELKAPAWDGGIVQEVHVATGQTIVSPTLITTVNGIQRYAYTPLVPFYRTIALADTGEDVKALNQLLTDFGYPTKVGNNATPATIAGVKKLAKRIGANPESEAFDPSWMIYLPNPITISSSHLTAGATVPAQGEEILTGEPEILFAKLVKPGTISTTNSSFTQSEQAFNSQTQSEPTELEIPEESLVFLTAEQRLVISENPIQLNDDKNTIHPDNFAELKKMVNTGATSIKADIYSPQDPNNWVIPTNSILTSQDRTTCVVVNNLQTVKPVTVIRTDLNQSNVSADFEPSDKLLLIPAEKVKNCESQ